MSSGDPKRKAPAGGDDVNRKLHIRIKGARELLSNDKEAFQQFSVSDLWIEMLLNRAVAHVTYKELSELRDQSAEYSPSIVELRRSLGDLTAIVRKSLAVDLQGNGKCAMPEEQNHALGAELEVERRRTDALVADIITIKSELEASKTATEQERRIDALVEENRTLKRELNTLKTTIDEKIKAAIEQAIPGDLKAQLKMNTRRTFTCIDDIAELFEDVEKVNARVDALEEEVPKMDEDGSDEDDSDDDEEEEGDGSERGEGNVEEHPHDGSEDSDGGDSCDKSEARDGGDDGADDDDSSDKSESAHIQGEKEDSGSEDESERCSLAGQLGAREDIEAGGGSDGVGEEYHNGTKRHDFKDRKLDAGDLPPFSSEALVLDKVRRIRQSRSKQHSGGRGGASYSSTMPSACDRSIGLPKLRSHSTTNPPSSGAPTPPSSAMSVAIQIDQRRLSDGLTSELKKEVETAKVAAMKEITEAARMVDEKADRLDRMMMDFETRMAQAYTTTQVADVGRQSPNVTDHVTPSTWSTHRGIREIRYDLPRSDKSAKHSDSHASATASSAQTPSAPKTSPGFSAARKIISYLPGSLSHSKASTGSTPGTSEMGAANRWPSEWPMYWEGGDPTGLGRERKDDGEAGDTGVAEWELQAELSEFIGSLDDYLLPLRPKPKPSSH